MVKPGFMCIAHRGASAYAPENTFAAFDLALALGAQHLELDVRASADGYVVVLHDGTLNRTTSGSGPVGERTLAALMALDAGSWFDGRYAGERIPVFRDVLGRYAGRAHLHVEIKCRDVGFSGRVVDEIRGCGAMGHVTVTAFDLETLTEVRDCSGELPTGWLVREVTEDVVAAAKRLCVAQLCPKSPGLTPELVRYLHREGFTVRAWGVTSEEVMREVVRAGADGMTVNYPDVLLSYLEEHPEGEDSDWWCL